VNKVKEGAEERVEEVKLEKVRALYEKERKKEEEERMGSLPDDVHYLLTFLVYYTTH
jgi:hypothetical protein